MIFRNTAIRVLSLATSLLFVLAIKYVSNNPDDVSVNIMLTTLFFSLLRSGFTFNVLSNKRSDINPLLCLTIDKPILVFLALLYSHHLNVPIEQAIYALFTASILTLIYRRQYTGYTKGKIYHSLIISFLFPLQVTINVIFDYHHPELIFIILLTAAILYSAYDRFFTTNDKMGLIEIYYSLLLPIGGFSAISIEGIDKPLYMIISKAVDSTGTVASFVVQGNLKSARTYMKNKNITLLMSLTAATFFFISLLIYLMDSENTYMVFSITILVNIIWLIYSMFTLTFLIKHGAEAVRNIYIHAVSFSMLLTGLFFLGYSDSIHIIFALSASFIFSMLIAQSTVKSSPSLY